MFVYFDDATETKIIMNNLLSQRILLFCCAFSIILVPLFLCSPLPLVDYTNHLARMHILVNINASEYLSSYYKMEWSALPNLAMDLIVPILANAVTVETATLLFAILTLFTMASGVIAANWALFGNKSLFPFLVFLFLFNKYFLLGVLNFLFSVGLAFWIFAAWVRFRDRPISIRFPVFSLFSICLYFSHLYGVGIYGILVGGYELHRCLSRQRGENLKSVQEWTVTVGQFVAPAILFLFCSETTSNWDGIQYGNYLLRLTGLLHPFVNYSTPLDVLTGLALGALLIVGLWQRKLIIHPFMFIPFGVLVTIYATIPDLMFSGSLGATRMIVPLSLTALAAIDWRIESKTWRKALVMCVGCLFLVRMGVVTANWWATDKVYAENIKLIDNLEEGARLYYAAARSKSPFPNSSPVSQFATMAVVRRDALVNGLYVFPSQQVLRYRYPPYAPTIQDGRAPHPTVYILDDLKRDKVNEDVFAHADRRVFQYVVLYNADAFSAEPPDHVRPIASNGNVVLYRIDPLTDAQPAPPGDRH